MAKVTGFTADRMLVIENETVVDGEVQGDNLILTTREGTPIDAGNVRGPAGPPGPPSGLASVNEQTGAVIAPRIFANKTDLDLWTSAPVGTVAVTSNDESIWEKNASGWNLLTSTRTYASTTEMNTKWPNAPVGSKAVLTDTNSSWYKGASSWNLDNGVRVFTDANQRNAQWPNAPIGAMSMFLGPGAGNWLEVKTADGWRPPPGAILSNYSAPVPQVNLVGAGLRDVGTIHQGQTYTHYTTVTAISTLQCGFGGDWTGWGHDIFAFGPNAVPYGGNTAGSAGAGVWGTSVVAVSYGVPAGQSVGYKVRCHPNQFGGGGNNIWVNGHMQIIVNAW